MPETGRPWSSPSNPLGEDSGPGRPTHRPDGIPRSQGAAIRYLPAHDRDEMTTMPDDAQVTGELLGEWLA
jgi:hypothetical protein